MASTPARREIYAVQFDWDPSRSWTAFLAGEDDRGPDNLSGWGATADDAIDDLLARIEQAASTT